MITPDVSTENVAAADPQTFTHTPGAAPTGVVVTIAHSTTANDIVSSVTYGGVALDRIDSVDNPTHLGRAYLYMGGTGLPSGAQTVSVDRTEGTTSVQVVCETVTGTADTEVVSQGQDRRNGADPAVALTVAGRTSLAFAVVFSGHNTVGGLTENTGFTRRQDNAFGGSEVAVVERQTVASTADVVAGWTATGDQIAMLAASLSEVQTVAEPDVIPSFGGSSLPRSPAFIAAAIRKARTLADLIRTLATELPRFAQSVKCYERVAVLPYAVTVRPSGDVERVNLIPVTNTSAFAIANPTNAREGTEITFDIYNNSGGTLGAITWGGQFELAQSFTAPSNGKHRLISFYRTATGLWRELYRTVNDSD